LSLEFFALRFGLAVLAVWRLTHLISSEAGPFDLFARLRRSLAGTQAGNMIDCPFCLSMWIAIPGAVFLQVPLLESVVAWLALSGAVCLIERSSRPPVVFQPLESTDISEEVYT
jgi:hypothetical protein